MAVGGKRRWAAQLKDPQIRERVRLAGWQVHTNPKTFSPEVNAKRSAAIVEGLLGWCPLDRRAEYKKLRRESTAAEARRIIEDDMAAAARRIVRQHIDAMERKVQRQKAQAY